MADLIRAKALTKDSIILLLDLISKHNVITSKCTNTNNNKLKEEAWKSIAQEFSAVTGEKRRPEQLRLKWENLKKAPRKRSALIRHNNLKTGGGKAFIPPDEVLERVASILGATCTGLTAIFGGDGENDVMVGQVPSEEFDSQSLSEPPQGSSGLVLRNNCGYEAGGGGDVANVTKKNVLCNTQNKTFNKRRKLSEEVQKAQRDKDLGIAAYFQAKATKVMLESKQIELQNKKIDLECLKLDLEIKNIKKKIDCEP